MKNEIIYSLNLKNNTNLEVRKIIIKEEPCLLLHNDFLVEYFVDEFKVATLRFFLSKLNYSIIYNVHSYKQHQNYMFELLNEVLNVIKNNLDKDNSFVKLQVESWNCRAINLYRRLGFLTIKTILNGNVLVMLKKF